MKAPRKSRDDTTFQKCEALENWVIKKKIVLLFFIFLYKKQQLISHCDRVCSLCLNLLELKLVRDEKERGGTKKKEGSMVDYKTTQKITKVVNSVPIEGRYLE